MRSRRFVYGLILITVYLLIESSPLAMSYLSSKDGHAHAATGNCCCSCCCSPERKASHTCCCCKKNKTADMETENVSACCKKKRSSTNEPQLKWNCPCGKSKRIAFWGGNDHKLLPFRFLEDIPSFCDVPHVRYLPQRMMSRCVEPPVPPPKKILS